MSHGYVFVLLCYIGRTTRIAHKVSYIHIGVRLRVARFDKPGNAKAFNRGASNKCWLHAFCLLCTYWSRRYKC